MHCLTHGLDDCPLCRNVPAKAERQRAIQRRLEEKAMRKHGSKNPYKHFGEDRHH